MSANYRRTTGSINVMNRWAQESRMARPVVSDEEKAALHQARLDAAVAKCKTALASRGVKVG
jgi:hypothetical protein